MNWLAELPWSWIGLGMGPGVLASILVFLLWLKPWVDDYGEMDD